MREEFNQRLIARRRPANYHPVRELEQAYQCDAAAAVRAHLVLYFAGKQFRPKSCGNAMQL
jgi:hypothetical protein